ncbi:O-succinylhomoserine sulfhydrylase [Pleomorphomonas carboxyditropha]|uniref:O-succinylhomoserine sulfhydrylase n=2 Tax=Pleomorphomonas carboxyditropha TaxID=2023338 RepID=A0A2G9WYK2_9HYPH|nr:O-succinylhomoserine sulfhydrylase [Pleomorphomonas carboxyditropha]
MKDEDMTKVDWHPDTALVHGGSLRSQWGETSESMFVTQGFVYDSAEQAEARFLNLDPGFQYSRFSNPTVAMFEERMALLEGAPVARATATGMAAVTAAILSQASAGDHIVAARALFGSCRYIVEDLAPRFGISCTLVDGRDLDQWRAAVRPNTRVFFFESPTNPTLEVVDIAAVAEIAHATGARLVVDNVFATALYQKPLELGADVVAYSATKHIDGQGRCLGGVVLCDEEFLETYLQVFLRQTGPTMSPFNAWVMLKALETFSLRVSRQTESAAKIAAFLEGHPKVEQVIYPGSKSHPQADICARQMTGGSTMIAVEVKGGRDGAFAAVNKLGIIKISNNLGDAKSLVTHPSTTTHQRFTEEVRQELGIRQGLLRLSVGLEHADDLIADLEQALG